MAWRGEARQARLGQARHGWARHGEARQARLGVARHGEARQARQGKARLGTAGQGRRGDMAHGTVKITISVPTAVRARMRSFKRDTNWSRVCTLAIEREIAMLESRAAKHDDAIDVGALRRLKDEALRFKADELRQARSDGRQWAQAAPYRELRSLRLALKSGGVELERFRERYADQSGEYVATFARAAIEVLEEVEAS